MEQKRKTKVQGRSRDAERLATPQYCEVLRSMGGTLPSWKKGHCPCYRTHDLGNTKNVSFDSLASQGTLSLSILAHTF